MRSPQQQAYTAIMGIAKEVIGAENVYDYLPTAGTRYPFIFIAEQFSNDVLNKSLATVEITQVIHLYSNNIDQRGTATEILNNLIIKIREMRKTKSFYVDILDIRTAMNYDNTTNTPLIHGTLDVKLRLF